MDFGDDPPGWEYELRGDSRYLYTIHNFGIRYIQKYDIGSGTIVDEGFFDPSGRIARNPYPNKEGRQKPFKPIEQEGY